MEVDIRSVWNVDGSRLKVSQPYRKLMGFDFRQISMPQGEHSSNFINFMCAWETRQILSNFLATGRLSVLFCHLSVLPGELLPNFVNFACGKKTC